MTMIIFEAFVGKTLVSAAIGYGIRCHLYVLSARPAEEAASLETPGVVFFAFARSAYPLLVFVIDVVPRHLETVNPIRNLILANLQLFQ